MDHVRVLDELKYLSTNGVTLNLEERMNVDLALK